MTNKRFQVSIRLADGTYSVSSRIGHITAAAAKREVERVLDAAGHKGYRVEGVKRISL